MSEKSAKQPLVPRLRFPEFRDAWTSFPLSAIADFVGDKISIDQITPSQYVSTESLLPEFGGITPAAKRPAVSLVTSFRPGDILVSNIRPYLKKIWQANIQGGASNDVIVVRASRHVRPDYLAAILRSDLFINYVMRGAKGVKMPRGDISMIRIFPVPCAHTCEQQKIAECLSSLDDRIAAEASKLDALMAHKKGLMQQLFPAEGEAAPRLRFPDFHASPEWITEPLGHLAVYENGKAYEPHIIEDGRFTVVNARFISSGGTIRKQTDADFCIADQGDVLMVLSDLPKGRALAKCFYVDIPHQYAVNQRVCRLTPHRVDGEFLYYALNRHPALLAYDDGLNQTHLRKDAVLSCPMILPRQREEQRRIADCLSVFDKLLASQRLKLSGLVGFKAGLMQQLFPSIDEVQA